MDRRDFLKVGAVSLIASSIPISLYHYLFSKNSKEFLRFHIKGILENEVELETYSKYIHPMFHDEREENIEGPGTIVEYNGENYIFTVNHVVSKIDVRINMGPPFGVQKYLIATKIEEVNTLGEHILERIVSESSRDIAIFKLPKGYKTPDYKVRLGDSDDIEILDEVYLLGYPQGIRRNIREGIIANKLGSAMYADGKIEEGFNISTGGYFGDSGTTVINSDGEVIGLFSQLHFGAISSFIRPINWYKTALNNLVSKIDKPGPGPLV